MKLEKEQKGQWQSDRDIETEPLIRGHPNAKSSDLARAKYFTKRIFSRLKFVFLPVFVAV